MKGQHLTELLEWMRSSLRLDPHPKAGTPLSYDTYEKHPQLAALDILGSIAVYPGGYCLVAEVEAYLDECDPASRASKTRKGRIAERLRGPPGRLLVYGMHRVWLVNIVAHPPGKAGAVLIRSCLHPHEGQVEGPGRVARLMGADRSWDGTLLGVGPLQLYHGATPRRVLASWRVGVARDLHVPLRYGLAGPFRMRRYRSGVTVEGCGDYPVMKLEDMPVPITRL